MKPGNNADHSDKFGRLHRAEPALSVVVYREPGPDDAAIAAHMKGIVEWHSPFDRGGGLGYVTFNDSDFKRLWNGVERGDLFGTAFAVLRFLGPKCEQFIGRQKEFDFGWIGTTDEQYGRLLLLQIILKPHILATLN